MSSYGYIAFLRGINVGGNNQIKMAELVTCLEKTGFKNVKTYIQSGNVLFNATENDTHKLAGKIESVIEKTFKINVAVCVFSEKKWKKVISEAPKKWGNEPNRKHNIFIMLEPYDMKEVVKNIGTLKPELETLVPGDGVLYQSASIELVGRTTTGKIASSPVYKRMTIRNYNTSVKLLAMLED